MNCAFVRAPHASVVHFKNCAGVHRLTGWCEEWHEACTSLVVLWRGHKGCASISVHGRLRALALARGRECESMHSTWTGAVLHALRVLGGRPEIRASCVCLGMCTEPFVPSVRVRVLAEMNVPSARSNVFQVRRCWRYDHMNAILCGFFRLFVLDRDWWLFSVDNGSFALLRCDHWALSLLPRSWFLFCHRVKAKLGLVMSFSAERSLGTTV